MKNDINDKLDMITEGKNSPFQIPYIVYENSKAREERREKRSFIVTLVLIFLLVFTNIFWVVYTNRFNKVETVTTDTINQEADGNSNNYSIIGNINGEQAKDYPHSQNN